MKYVLFILITTISLAIVTIYFHVIPAERGNMVAKSVIHNNSHPR